MRNFKWALVASLAVATTGCVETVDSNYPNAGYGYADSGYSNGYYAPGYYAPAYTASRVDPYYASRPYAPQVVRETRAAPAPQAQHQADRGNDRPNNDGRRNDHAAPTTASNAGDHGTPQSHRDHNSQDRDGDGRPDRRS
jgi:hypothetical protein